MIMQTQITKGELLLEIHGKTIGTAIKDITPSGIRVEQNSQGLASGRYSARHFDTLDLFMRHDGTFEFSSKDLERTTEGDLIVGTTRGAGTMTSPNLYKGEGDVFFTTNSPKFSWLNNKKGRVEISGDLKTDEITAKVFGL